MLETKYHSKSQGVFNLLLVITNAKIDKRFSFKKLLCLKTNVSVFSYLSIDFK
ncbi:hypothetical protein HYD72_00870 [Mycoplasmopsis bovis]|nr:hypothetical protein [Mycoplasmopsis bovis]QQH49237.1 hypothetical protein HYD72_00870 [Mycoplasmopsis bovis]